MTETHLDKERLLEFIETAKELAGYYDAENGKSPRTPYHYGSVDAIALRLFEQSEGFVAIGITLRGNNVNIHGRRGYLSADGILAVTPNTITYALEDFKGTTVARFVTSLCDVLTTRATNGHIELREIMVPKVLGYARRTREEVRRYTS